MNRFHTTAGHDCHQWSDSLGVMIGEPARRRCVSTLVAAAVREAIPWPSAQC